MAERKLAPTATCTRTHGVTYAGKRDLIAARKSFGLNNDQAKPYRCLDCGRWHLVLAGRERVSELAMPDPKNGGKNDG